MASQGKIIGIVAWSLVVVLLVGAGTLAFLNQQQAGRAAALSDAFLQVGTTAGIEGLSPDSLKGDKAVSDILQQVQKAILGQKQELATAKDALAAAQAEASGAKAESASLSQRMQEETAKSEALSKDMTAKDEELSAAKAAAEKAGQEVQAAQQAVDKQKAEAEKTLADLKAQMAEESARLQAELEAARQQAQEVAATSAKKSVPEPVVEEEPGRIVGQSQMFSLIRYTEEKQNLSFVLQDGQTLSYQGVPLDVYEGLINAGDKLDMHYRFKIQSAFKSIPPDSVVVRKFWKGQRYKPARNDVRVIEHLIPPVVEAAPAEASAEAPAAEAAVETAPAVK